jgi:hypothetical protein
MTLNKTLLIAVALSSPPERAALAQWPSDVVEGARVRVEVPEQQYQADNRRGHLLRGRVTAVAGDTLYLAVADSLGPLAIPRTLVQRLDLSCGVPSRAASAVRRGSWWERAVPWPACWSLASTTTRGAATRTPPP